LRKHIYGRLPERPHCEFRKVYAARACRTFGDAEYEVTIEYTPQDDHWGERDTLKLCAECADRLTEDAEGHGYKVTRTKITNEGGKK
jgi:hypothetical protein